MIVKASWRSVSDRDRRAQLPSSIVTIASAAVDRTVVGIDAEARSISAARTSRWAIVVGAAIVVGFGSAVVLAVVGLALGIAVGAWILGAAALGALLVAFLGWRGEAGSAVRVSITAMAAVIIVIACVLAVGGTADTSVDGRQYHGEAVWALADGWNPIRDSPLPHTADQGPDRINSFPKAMWILEAAVLDAGGSIANVKGIGMAIAAATALIALGVFVAIGMRTLLSAVLAITVALNPVAGAQFSTKLVDGVIANLLAIAVLLTVLSCLRRRADVVVVLALVMSVILMVNTKYSGISYAVGILIPTAVGGGLLAGRRGRSLLWPALLFIGALVVGLLVVGWNPYVTNTMRHHNPLYILVGDGAVDPSGSTTVGVMKRASEPERLLRSLASRSSTSPQDPQLRWPLVPSASEWTAFRKPGIPIGGFGPLLLDGLLGALAILFAAARRRDGWPPASRVLLASAGAVFVTWAISPSAWIARLAPQLWLAPLFVAAAVILATPRRWLRAGAVVVVLILAVDGLGVAQSAFVWGQRNTARENASLARLRELPGPLTAAFTSFTIAEERRLRSRGIAFRGVDHVSCVRPWVLSVNGVLARPARMPARPTVAICPRA